MPTAFKTLADWIDVPSVTGTEDDYANLIALYLSRLGFDVERQELEPGRSNLLARVGESGEPRVVLCTHLDTVPPWIGPRIERNVIFGRGACDAKGPALAMIMAAERLVKAGRRDIGLLLTVGEEVDGAGACLANSELRSPWRPAFTIIGEPTENHFVAGHKGVLKCTARAHGVAGHSSQPIGPSAVHELVSVLSKLLAEEWGHDELFGHGTLNVGMIDGGVAENVVADRAEARLMLRIVEDPKFVEERIRRYESEHIEFLIEKAYGPLAFEVPSVETDARVVAFATDGPFLPDWGTKLLYGPGSILDAHTDHEKLTLDEFERAVAEYERTALELLLRLDAEEEL
ncbi:MAG: acetylornithine deacetylase [Planctomycetota bacterium]|jgi:acetylornithine deacetylase